MKLLMKLKGEKCNMNFIVLLMTIHFATYMFYLYSIKRDTEETNKILKEIKSLLELNTK